MTNRPVSLWRHFFEAEESEQQLTQSMTSWQQTWNWDYLKLNPPASYHVLDWGAEYRFFEDPNREPELTRPAIITSADFDHLHDLDIRQGMLGTQLRVTANLRKSFGEKLPIYQTIFSPIEIAHRLMTGRDALLVFIRNNADMVHKLLKLISSVYGRFATETLRAGANGIFFATKWACRDRFTWSQYQEFGSAYELPLLNRIRDAGGSIILHVCGGNNYLREMMAYPVDAFSYDFFAPGVPAPQEVEQQSRKPVIGGVDPEKLRTSASLVIDDCRRLTDLKNWWIGPSCVVLPDTPEENIREFRNRIRDL